MKNIFQNIAYVKIISFPRFCLVLDHRGRLEAWEGRLGVLMRNLRTMRVVYWVNVSESSGAGFTGSSG